MWPFPLHDFELVPLSWDNDGTSGFCCQCPTIDYLALDSEINGFSSDLKQKTQMKQLKHEEELCRDFILPLEMGQEF